MLKEPGLLHIVHIVFANKFYLLTGTTLIKLGMRKFKNKNSVMQIDEVTINYFYIF